MELPTLKELLAGVRAWMAETTFDFPAEAGEQVDELVVKCAETTTTLEEVIGPLLQLEDLICGLQ